jgi:hypothetical protein
MAHDPLPPVVIDLSRLLTAAALSERDRATGHGLLHRLSAPVKVALMGPDTQAAKAILSACQTTKIRASVATEVSLGGRIDDADIVLWCTRSFAVTESAAWTRAPNILKDNSFLVGCAPDAEDLPHLEEAAAEDFAAFHYLHNVGDHAGIQALLVALDQQIQNGAQAVRDYATLFVQRHRAILPTEAPDVPDVVPFVASVTTIVPDEQPKAAPSGADPVLQDAMAQMTRYATALTQLTEADPTSLCEGIFELCGRATEDLVELFASGASDHPDYVALRDTINVAADNIMLMSLENDLNSAADAVTILVQVRKDLNVCSAA